MYLKIILIFLFTVISSISYAGAPAAIPATSSNQSEAVTILPASEGLKFVRPWARPTTNVDGKISNSAMYLKLINTTDTDYKLINVSSDSANKTELHQTFTNEEGVTQMRKIDNLLIPHNTEVDFVPGGSHVMLYDLKRPLNIGDKFEVTFFFDDASTKTLTVEVMNK